MDAFQFATLTGSWLLKMEDIHGKQCYNGRSGSGEKLVPRVVRGRVRTLHRVKAAQTRPGFDYFKELSPCMVAMETCLGGNWWCRKLRELGYDARLIPAVQSKAYVWGQKNDPADARSICEEAQRPNMRFAPPKSESASALLTMHRTRHALIKQRTLSRNHVRGTCAEFGLVEPPGTKGFEGLASKLKADGDDLPSALKESQRGNITLRSWS